MGGLQRFEQRLEQLVSGVFARTFRSAVQPVEIAAALAREADNSAQILSRDRRLVPNDFHVELSPPDHERLSNLGTTLPQELIGHDTRRRYGEAAQRRTHRLEPRERRGAKMVEQRLGWVGQRGAPFVRRQAVDLAEADRHGKVELRCPTSLQQRHELLEDQKPIERGGGAIGRRLEEPQHAVTRRHLAIQLLSGRAQAMRRVDRELTGRIDERDAQLTDLSAGFHLPKR